jgi:hypothetical protein
MTDRGTPKPRSGDISPRFCRLISATLLVIVGAASVLGRRNRFRPRMLGPAAPLCL